MKTMLAASLLGLAMTLCGVPGVVAPVAVQAAQGWRLAGRYCTYEAACCKADHLDACGYETCIKPRCGYYCVYYK